MWGHAGVNNGDPLTVERVRTPGGNPAMFVCRQGVSDRQIIRNVCENDEYGVGAVSLTTMDGWAIDIGAHIGGVAVPLAIDNPALKVIAVEPVPENARLIRVNAELNGVRDRVMVVQAIAGEADSVAWGYDGQHHFVANAETEGATVHGTGINVTIDTLCAQFRIGHPDVSLLKIDCEGCEWSLIAPSAVSDMPVVVGEFHGNPADLIARMPRHDFRTDGFTFTATLTPA
jgi:FkbM family methyltransferase